MIFISLFYSLYIIVKSQIIIVPFKTIIQNKLTHENYISELKNNKIYIDLKIGTPSQKIPAILKLSQVPFFITSSTYNKDITKFNSSESTSYYQKNNKESSSFNKYDFIKAYLGEDIISIQNISNKDIFLDKAQFYLALNLSENCENISGEIGLNIIYPHFISFLNQLKDNNLIKDYIFSIKYTSENEGELHFGNYYHLYDNNEQYKITDFKSMTIGIPRVNLDKWVLNFDNIILGTGNKTFLTTVELSYELGFIYGSYHYFGLIKKIFFDEYESKNICEIKHFGDNDFYYVCNLNINLNKFPDLIFLKDDFNFTFTKNDLWKKFDNKYYFLVIFNEDKNFNWKFGKIFFKKYIIFFNQDAKLIGFYPHSDINNKKKENDKKFKIELSWVLVILLAIILILIIIYVIYYLKIKKRKIRVNELDEYYEYTSENNNKEPLPINNE